MDKSHHDYELELLKREKEEALAEEVKTTKAGTDCLHILYLYAKQDQFHCL